MNSVVSQDSVFIASETKLILKWLQKKKIQLTSHVIEKVNDSGTVGGKDSNICVCVCVCVFTL